MGQYLPRLLSEVNEFERQVKLNQQKNGMAVTEKFPDIAQLPPELALLVLSKLDATDLCLAGCVWKDLGQVDILWQGLCKASWTSCHQYSVWKNSPRFSFKKLYLLLDEGCLTFNADWKQGMDYLLKHEIVTEDAMSIAKFFHGTYKLDRKQKMSFLETRPDVLDLLVKLQNFQKQFLPNALRKFFRDIQAPTERGSYLSSMMEKFSAQFCECNPDVGLSRDAVFVVCFSLIMLSVDLCSPQVKNKMSKREFIRNTCRATEGLNDEYAGHLYDNIYLVGHVASPER
ncbi:unnamed protein product [Owenia fusiformis]|uniref:Uncharacterized protein n=1 Tax=Owenia fusiformis TaxID=6347 RepID=A0A8J1TGQ8_OWEFU|nr:unnamed protein product [Owenia fusiformis]